MKCTNKILAAILVLGTLALTACGGGSKEQPFQYRVQIAGTGSPEILVLMTYKSDEKVGEYQDPINNYTEVTSTLPYAATVDIYETSLDTGDNFLYTLDIERQPDYAIINGKKYKVSIIDNLGSVVQYDPKNP